MHLRELYLWVYYTMLHFVVIWMHLRGSYLRVHNHGGWRIFIWGRCQVWLKFRMLVHMKQCMVPVVWALGCVYTTVTYREIEARSIPSIRTPNNVDQYIKKNTRSPRIQNNKSTNCLSRIMIKWRRFAAHHLDYKYPSSSPSLEYNQLVEQYDRVGRFVVAIAFREACNASVTTQ